MKNKLTLQPKKAFTLVELIVVVTILAIIGTIGFVSYTDYLSGVRDTNRTVQLESIGDGLKLSLTRGRLPIPDDYIEVKTNGNTIAYQGYAGEEVLKKIKYDKEGKDPLDNTYFSYYATDNRKNFQLMALLEETNETVSLFKGEVLSNDIDYADRQVKVSGKKLGILTGGGDNLNVPVQEIGEIKDNGELDIATTGEEYISHIDDIDKISGSGSELIKSIYNSSCKRILESSLDNGDGIYKINPAGTEEFEVYCDMSTDGGGWTFLWKNYGGPGATGISNENLLVSNQNDLVIPQKNGGEFNSEINTNAWNYFKELENVELIKLASYKNRPSEFTLAFGSGTGVWNKIHLDLGESVTFSDLFDLTNPNIFTNSYGDDCLKLDNQVEMFIDDSSYGKSDYIFFRNNESFGFANSHQDRDFCGETNQDNLMNGWGARHVISYVHNQNEQNAVRCQFQCWNGTENYWIETAWGIRER